MVLLEKIEDGFIYYIFSFGTTWSIVRILRGNVLTETSPGGKSKMFFNGSRLSIFMCCDKNSSKSSGSTGSVSES